MFLEKMFHLASVVKSSVQSYISNGGKDLVYPPLLIVPVMGTRLVVNQFFKLKTYTDLFPCTFHSIIANLHVEIPSNGTMLRISWIGLSQPVFTTLSPSHGHHRLKIHVPERKDNLSGQCSVASGAYQKPKGTSEPS